MIPIFTVIYYFFKFFFGGGCISVGRNVVEVDYTNEYDNDGAGLHQFIDPEDNKEYLYTNLEVMIQNLRVKLYSQALL